MLSNVMHLVPLHLLHCRACITPVQLTEPKLTDHSCRVNGVALRPDGFEMHATLASVTAADCVLQHPGHIEVTVGTSSSFKLKLSDAEQLAKRFDGSENITALISGGCFVFATDAQQVLQQLSLALML